MKTHVRCGTLFAAADPEARSGQSLVYDARGVLEFVGPTEQAPRAAQAETVLDYSRQFVMPGRPTQHRSRLGNGSAVDTTSARGVPAYRLFRPASLDDLIFTRLLACDAGQDRLSMRNPFGYGCSTGRASAPPGPTSRHARA